MVFLVGKCIEKKRKYIEFMYRNVIEEYVKKI